MLIASFFPAVFRCQLWAVWLYHTVPHHLAEGMIIAKQRIIQHGMGLDDWLTAHRSITLVDLQLHAQNSCLFTYNTFIKILYMFRALPCSSSGGLHRN